MGVVKSLRAVPGCAGAMVDAALEEIAPRLMKNSFDGCKTVTGGYSSVLSVC